MRFLSVLSLVCFSACAMPQPTSFSEFLQAMEAAGADEKQRMADAFVAGILAPLVEEDSIAVFIHRGDAQFTGDPTLWAEPQPMTPVPGTDLFYFRSALPREARIEYMLLSEENPMGFPDPLNPHRVLSGFGPFSELAMPGYEYPDVFDAVRDGSPGGYERVTLHEIPPGVLPYGHEVHVYLPPAYADGGGPYPTLYLQDGRDYIEFAHVPRVLDHLISANRIRPVIAIFVTPPNRFQPEMPNRMTEYGLNDDYVRFLSDELVPFIDATYPTIADPAARLVTGDSFGGLISTFVPFQRPDVFGLGYSQSGYHSFQGDRMIELVSESSPQPVQLFVDVGLFERTVGAGWLPDAETDFLEANRRLRDVLAEKGYDFEYREYPEGHTWGNWRVHLMDALVHFFPPLE